ncbi:MAG: hypothetical protein J0M22_14435 [Gammaproteobacteria bacterium]|nr:hypothetical protein [Gammaproteobacteria bacterium]
MKKIICIVEDPIVVNNELHGNENEEVAVTSQTLRSKIGATGGVLGNLIDKVQEPQNNNDWKTIFSNLFASSAAQTFLSSFLLKRVGMIALGSNPVSMLIAIAVAAPNLLSLLEAGDGNISESDKKTLQNVLKDMQVPVSKAKSDGFIFPLGHPVLGQLYQLHPLADFDPSKSKFYIPEDEFEDYVMEEKQSELIRLLVQLGATKIEIIEDNEQKNGADNALQVDVSATPAIKTDENVQANVVALGNERTKNNQNRTQKTKHFLLKGTSKQFDEDNTKASKWYPFEPQWQSIVFARTFGGCQSATIHLTQTLSLTSKSKVAASIRSSLLSVGGSQNKNGNSDSQKTYSINVEFLQLDEI